MNKPVARQSLKLSMLPEIKGPLPEWEISRDLIAYEDAVSRMEKLVENIAAGVEPERIWLVEHPPLYSAGTSARDNGLIEPKRFPVHKTRRGGEYTYHGPGQRIAYVMLNLKRRQPDVRAFVGALEQWVINTLDQFNVVGERREDRVGVWVRRPEKAPLANDEMCEGEMREDKIAAIGIRIRRWVTLHGISINMEPDLTHYEGIIPCGIKEHGVTSLVDLGLPVTMDDLDLALKREFIRIFGEVE